MVRIHPDPPTDARPGSNGCRGRLVQVVPFPHGAIAQLGERLLCKQEVTGSIPVGSTRTFADCSEKGRPFSVQFVLFGCSLTIRKKQGGSGTLQRPDSLGKRLHWKYRDCRLVGGNPAKRKEKPVAACRRAAGFFVHPSHGAHRYRVK